MLHPASATYRFSQCYYRCYDDFSDPNMLSLRVVPIIYRPLLLCFSLRAMVAVCRNILQIRNRF